VTDEPLYERPADLELPEFEGVIPVGVVTRVSGTGQRITRPIHYQERVLLLVEASATSVGHSKTNDGMKRVHTLAVTDLYELTGPDAEKVLAGARAAYRLSDDAAHGRASLEFDDTAQPIISTDGVILTAREVAEQRGEQLPGDALGDVLVEFDGGARGRWPEDWLGLGQSLAAVGGTMRLPASAELGDVGRVVRWLSVDDPSVVLAEWSVEDEAARLVELEEAVAAEEARADREVVEGMTRPDAVAAAQAIGREVAGVPWPGYPGAKVTELRTEIRSGAHDEDLELALSYERGHKGRPMLLKAIKDRLAVLEAEA